MDLDNYQLFCEHLKDSVVRYPNLKICTRSNGVLFLKGILDIHNDHQIIVGNFLIEIHYTENYPYRFPILFETGKQIPAKADFHKYDDESCCITVLPNELLNCKDGITILSFINQFAIPYLANFLHYKQTGKYRNGEFAHGLFGLFQFYAALFKTSNFTLWKHYFNYVFSKNAITMGRNDKCFCGSNLKYKNCHLPIFYKLQIIGEKQILNDFKLLML